MRSAAVSGATRSDATFIIARSPTRSEATSKEERFALPAGICAVAIA